MAEAVGLAVGVASFGIQLCGSIITYIDALAERKDEIDAVASQARILESLLGTIRTTCTKHEAEHAEAARAASECLLACEADLGAVRDVMVKLCGVPVADPSFKQLLKDKAKKMTYPLRKSVLDQVLNRLGRVTQVLQSALQNLSLDASFSTETTMHSLQRMALDTQSVLALVETQISSVSQTNALLVQAASSWSQAQIVNDSNERKMDSLLEGVSRIESALQQLNLSKHPNQSSQQEIIGRLIAKPSNLQALSNDLQESFSDYSLASRLGSNRFSCSCRRRHVRQSWFSRWGPLRLFDEASSTISHERTCRFSKFQDVQVKRLVGIESLLGAAIALSFEMSSGAGGLGISPRFTYRATVGPSSPAFRSLKIFHDAAVLQCQNPQNVSRLMDKVIETIDGFFRSKRAHPTDVNNRNESLVHVAAREVRCDSTLLTRVRLTSFDL
jgi:hypothetical protein